MGGWDAQNARDGFFVGLADDYFITGFDVVRRFCRTAVEQNNARIAKLLSNCAARAKPAEF